MRHRFVLNLNDSNSLELDIIDDLCQLNNSERQEMLRMLVKAGYSSLIQHKNATQSIISAQTPEVLSTLLGVLIGSKQPYSGSDDSNTVDSSDSTKEEKINRIRVKSLRKTKKKIKSSDALPHVDFVDDKKTDLIENTFVSDLEISVNENQSKPPKSITESAKIISSKELPEINIDKNIPSVNMHINEDLAEDEDYIHTEKLINSIVDSDDDDEDDDYDPLAKLQQKSLN